MKLTLVIALAISAVSALSTESGDCVVSSLRVQEYLRETKAKLTLKFSRQMGCIEREGRRIGCGDQVCVCKNAARLKDPTENCVLSACPDRLQGTFSQASYIV